MQKEATEFVQSLRKQSIEAADKMKEAAEQEKLEAPARQKAQIRTWVDDHMDMLRRSFQKVSEAGRRSMVVGCVFILDSRQIERHADKGSSCDPASYMLKDLAKDLADRLRSEGFGFRLEITSHHGSMELNAHEREAIRNFCAGTGFSGDHHDCFSFFLIASW